MGKSKGQVIIKGESGIAFFEYTSWAHRYKKIEVNGKIKHLVAKGFATEEEAVKSYYQMKEKFEVTYREFNKTVDKDIFFKDYVIHWFENVFSLRVESTTKYVGNYIVYDLIIPCIGYDVKLSLVTREYLDGIIKSVAKMTSSGGSAARAYIIIAFTDALIGGYIKESVALETKSYKNQKPKIRVYSIPEMIKFLNATKASYWYLEILLGLFLGLRKGEIFGLKFSDYNLEDNSFFIQRQLNIEYVFSDDDRRKVIGTKLIEKDPKTDNSFRSLEVPDLIFEEFERRKTLVEINKKRYGNEYIDNGYICCQNTGEPRSRNAINEAVNKICDSISLPRITIHGLRHMCATIILEQGGSLAKVSAFLGHSSIHTTFEYYCEVMDENEKILNFMNETFAVEMDEDYVVG